MLRIPTVGSFLRASTRVRLSCVRLYRRASDETFYDILGVKRTANDKEIKDAYIKLCKQFHPDSNSADKKLHEKFIKISQAYAVLSKPEEKKLYDAALRAGLNPEPGEKFTTEDWDPKKPMYYYHPRFYQDPKMRAAAAKAWEQNTGISFDAYTRDGSDNQGSRHMSKESALQFTLLMLVGGGCIAMLAYLIGKSYVSERRTASFLANKRFDEQSVRDVEAWAKPRSRRLDDDSAPRKTPVSKDVEQEKDLSLDYLAKPEKPLGT